MGRTYIYRINYCIHWTKICVQKLKSFHWTRKSLLVSIERESNKGKEFDIDMKSNDLHVIWNNFKIDKPPYCTCVLLRDHFFVLKQHLALDFLIPNCTRNVQSTNTNLQWWKLSNTSGWVNVTSGLQKQKKFDSNWIVCNSNVLKTVGCI